MNMKFAALRRARHPCTGRPPRRSAGRRQRLLSRRRHFPGQHGTQPRRLRQRRCRRQRLQGHRWLPPARLAGGRSELHGSRRRQRGRHFDRLERHHASRHWCSRNSASSTCTREPAWPMWDTDFDDSGRAAISDDGWEPTYGVGVGVHFGSLGVRARVRDDSAPNLSMTSRDLASWTSISAPSRSASRTHFCSIAHHRSHRNHMISGRSFLEIFGTFQEGRCLNT